MIEEVSEEQFTEKVLDADGRILVEFFATWCPHCQAEAPIVDRLADEERGVVKVYRVDVDKSPELAQVYASEGFPCFVLFENGQVVDRKLGEQPIMSLERMVA